MEIGIRELRNNLASVMDAVDGGTTVTITHHGRPRATIRPVVDADEGIVARGIREGWLEPATGSSVQRPERRPRGSHRGPGTTSALDALMDDRSDDR